MVDKIGDARGSRATQRLVGTPRPARPNDEVRSDFTFLGEAVRHELAGLEHLDDGPHHVVLCSRRLGVLEGRTNSVMPPATDVDHRAVPDESGHEGEH